MLLRVARVLETIARRRLEEVSREEAGRDVIRREEARLEEAHRLAVRATAADARPPLPSHLLSLEATERLTR
ncbi:hypothetical protein Aph01nite_33380 [Acrocarpospora phusangensis]|uniref:Uncharacterized protein n=1 Tax=Acrocarpospora phusangensis TaxID=1070424 RepID=A0A919QAF9_9ACTN|nr:hypothetical protein [Acrocarpospora phusangensis]GIH25028.1 hypothetical protein Aph01nite_33380 [Acrocarpospora phusangensis]